MKSFDSDPIILLVGKDFATLRV